MQQVQSRHLWLKNTVLFCLFLALGGLGSCFSPSPTNQARETSGDLQFLGDTLTKWPHFPMAAYQGDLTIAMEVEPPTLNCHLDPLDGWSRKICALVLNSLAYSDPVTWKHQPSLAERWDISDDQRTFTFYLRDDVLWHDGQPFGADDVIFTFEQLRAPTSRTLAIRTYLEPIMHFKKINDYIVRFQLKQPYCFAFDTLSELYILPKHIYAQGDFNTHPANRHPIGTGAFRFDRWQTGDKIILKRNERYFKGPVFLDSIVFKHVADPTIRTQMLRRGDLDVVERLSSSQWNQLSKDTELRHTFYWIRHLPAGLQWIGWNTQRSFFKDPRVRQALAYMIDTQDIVQKLRYGLDQPTASWFLPGSPDHHPHLKPRKFDPKRAQQLLKTAGWIDHNGDHIRDKNQVEFSFTFIYPAGPTFYGQLGTLLKEELARVGIVMHPQRLEWNVFMDRLVKHDFDACSLLWQLEPRTDPYQVWHSSAIEGGSNFVSFRHPRIDKLLEQARQTYASQQRSLLYHELSEILFKAQPYTLLFNRYNLSVVNKKWGGIVSSPPHVFEYQRFFRDPFVDR